MCDHKHKLLREYNFAVKRWCDLSAQLLSFIKAGDATAYHAVAPAVDQARFEAQESSAAYHGHLQTHACR
jgi:hypothetical protein